jgi:hypothetical protein
MFFSLSDDPFFSLLRIDQICIEQVVSFSGRSPTRLNLIAVIVEPLKFPL